MTAFTFAAATATVAATATATTAKELIRVTLSQLRLSQGYCTNTLSPVTRHEMTAGRSMTVHLTPETLPLPHKPKHTKTCLGSMRIKVVTD